MQYDAFLSYRRENGFLMAQMLHDRLQERGFQWKFYPRERFSGKLCIEQQGIPLVFRGIRVLVGKFHRHSLRLPNHFFLKKSGFSLFSIEKSRFRFDYQGNLKSGGKVLDKSPKILYDSSVKWV